MKEGITDPDAHMRLSGPQVGEPSLSTSAPAQEQSGSCPSRIPKTTSLDDVVTYWESGAPDKGLMVPLKLWSKVFKPLEYQSEAVKLSNIRYIWEEFTIHCNSDYDLFESRFPGLRNQYTKLRLAVLDARKARGEAKSRDRNHRNRRIQ